MLKKKLQNKKRTKIQRLCPWNSKKGHKHTKQNIRKKKMKEEIIEIYNESKQIMVFLKTVGYYMREIGIKKKIWLSPYKRTTIDSDFENNLKNSLDRKFFPSTPNTVWVTNITFIWTLNREKSFGFIFKRKRCNRHKQSKVIKKVRYSSTNPQLQRGSSKARSRLIYCPKTTYPFWVTLLRPACMASLGWKVHETMRKFE